MQIRNSIKELWKGECFNDLDPDAGNSTPDTNGHALNTTALNNHNGFSAMKRAKSWLVVIETSL